MKKLGLLLLLLLLAGCSTRYQNSPKSGDLITKKNDLSLDDNYYVAMQIAGDVTGDKIEDKIYFIGYQENKEKEDVVRQNYYTNLYLLIVNGADRTSQKILTKYTEGLCPSLIAEDFNSDGVRDIYTSLFTLPSGGANRTLVNIISYKDNNAITLFDDNSVIDGLKLSFSLKDQYIVEISSGRYDKTISFKMEKSICEWLEEERIYEKGCVISQPVITLDSFTELEATDINNDGIYELKGSQYLALMSHTGGLGFVKTKLGYDVSQKDWVVLGLDFQPFD